MANDGNDGNNDDYEDNEDDEEDYESGEVNYFTVKVVFSRESNWQSVSG